MAVTLEPVDPAGRAWMVVGLVLSLAGDVFLLGSRRWFVPGLVSFLAAHVAYVVGLLLAPTSPGWMLVCLALMAAAASPPSPGSPASAGASTPRSWARSSPTWS